MTYFIFYTIVFRSLTVGNIPSLKSTDIVSLVLNCESLNCFNLYRFDDLSDQDMRFMFDNPRLTNRLKELTLDRVFTLNEMSYEVCSGKLLYFFF